MLSYSAKTDCTMAITRIVNGMAIGVFLLLSVAFPNALCGQTAGNDTHLYFFTSQGCAPCEVVKPAIAKLDAAGYPVTTVDIRTSPDWASHFRVTKTPTVIMVRNQQIVGRHAGILPHSELLQWFATSGYVLPGTSESAPLAQKSGIAVASFADQSVDSSHAVAKSNTGKFDEANNSFSPIASLQSSTNQAQSTNGEFKSATLHKGTTQPANDSERIALEATVRIKVEDPKGFSYATGTVVHSHQNESLVVTCGHVFRESRGTGTISCEYGFADSQISVASGELIFYDAEARDIALLVMKTNGDNITPVEIASKQTSIEKGTDAFSIGCDHGESPTIRDTRIKNRAAYDGAIKYDIYGRPVDGRSGGGLFTDDGRLIGVCNAAVVDVDEGIYTALDTIHWQFEHTNLAHLFGPATASSSPLNVAAIERPPVESAPKQPVAKPLAASLASSFADAPKPRPRAAAEFPRSTPRTPGRSSLVSLKGRIRGK